MELKLFRALWGLDGPLSSVASQIVAAGYVGIEDALPAAEDCAALRADLQASGLEFIPVIEFEGVLDEQDQLRRFRDGLELAKTFEPAAVGAFLGRDEWSLSRSIEFFKHVAEIESEVGLRAHHETHRGLALFTPWNTVAILDAVPELRLCCDFSHWVVVCERLLEDQREAIELAARHAQHVHARVGYDQSPQVPDPRAPEYAQQLETFESWWKLIWEAQHAAGAQTSTLTPEYGPSPYLQTLPYTGAPVADLAAICDWQATRAREQFTAWREDVRTDTGQDPSLTPA
jgi:hypothetical protein